MSAPTGPVSAPHRADTAGPRGHDTDTGADSARPDVRPVSGHLSAPVSVDGQDRTHRLSCAGTPRTAYPGRTRDTQWPPNWPRPQQPDADAIEATAAWLDRETEAGTAAATCPVPTLGTPAWCALPDSEPAKWAAVFRAASTWYRDFLTIGERDQAQLREQIKLAELYMAERDRIETQQRREAVKHATGAMTRREREAKRAEHLPNRTGPELIGAAYASWGLDPPAPDSPAGTTPEPVEVA